MITIDGSLHEGGGAMLRQALSYSLLLKKPFTINNIRANRPKPGLSWQHLTALNTAHQISNAAVTGNALGSTTVTFTPKELTKTKLTIDIGTAGSTTLLLQSLLLPILFSGKEFKLAIKGGTDVQWSIPIDYFNNVLLPHTKKYADLQLKTQRRGFYPKGGGLIQLKSKSKKPLGQPLPKIQLLQQGTLFKISCISYASKDLQPQRVAERQAEAARIILSQLTTTIDIIQQYTDTPSTGSGIVITGTCGDEEGLNQINPVIFGSSCLGKQQLKAEHIGEQAAKDFKDIITSKAPVDQHLADQLLPIIAITGGKMKVQKITNHLKSNIYVAEQFLNTIIFIDEETNIVSCEPPTF